MKRWCVILDNGKESTSVAYSGDRDEVDFIAHVLRDVFRLIIIRSRNVDKTLSEAGMTAYVEERDVEQRP